MSYNQIPGTTNAKYKDDWVKEVLGRNQPLFKNPTLLDVGAGDAPYGDVARQLGYLYRSQDFSSYTPDNVNPGLQNESWDYPEMDFTCDISEIPDEATSNVVLCTEVLEHVPDPVRAFQRMAHLVEPGGKLIITVPLMSLMHQSPYWFQAGLSPFWFQHWAADQNLVIEELTVYGDYADYMSQEVGRLLTFKPRIKGLNRIGSRATRLLRARLPNDVLQSGGFGTLFIGRKC